MNPSTTIDHDRESDTILIKFLDTLRSCDNSIDVVETCAGPVSGIRVHLSWGNDERFDSSLCEILIAGVSKIPHPRPTLFGDIVLTAAELDAERYAQAMKQPDTRPDTSDSTNDAVDGGAVGDLSEESDTATDA